jgi:heme exporter protein B
LMAIVILPFTIPILIFGVASAAVGADAGLLRQDAFLILCALTLGSVVIGSVGAASALRHLLH